MAFALTALGGAEAALAATEPSTPTTPEEQAPPATEPPPEAAIAAEAVAEPAPAAEPEPALPPPAAPPPPVRVNTEEKERDSYEGPPLLFGKGTKVKVGAFGAVGGGYTRFMGRDSGVASLEAALLLDHRFSIGLAGYGFTRTPRGPDASDGARREFGAGYGGIAVRYSWLTSLPVYPTFGVVLGGGAVNLHREHDDDHWDWDDDDDDDEWRRGSFDPFFMVQPEVSLNANATRWLRLGLNVGYRFAGGVGRFGLDNGDLNGVVAGGNIAFGWF